MKKFYFDILTADNAYATPAVRADSLQEAIRKVDQMYGIKKIINVDNKPIGIKPHHRSYYGSSMAMIC